MRRGNSICNAGNVRAVAIVAIAAFAVAACSDLSTGSQQPASANLSVQSIPEGDLNYDLTVTGPGMDTVTEEITENQGELQLVLPSGSNRHFHIGARDSMFAGWNTVDLEPGEGVDVDLTIAPGPVVIDDAFYSEDDPSIFQIRDLSVDARAVDDEDEGTTRYLSLNDIDGIENGRVRDIEHADDGTWWVLVEGDEVEGIGVFVVELPAVFDEEVEPAFVTELRSTDIDRLDQPVSFRSMAVDSSRDRIAIANHFGNRPFVYIWNLEELSEDLDVDNAVGTYEIVEDESLDEYFIAEFEGPIEDYRDFTGLSFGPSGDLYALATASSDPQLLNIEPSDDTGGEVLDSRDVPRESGSGVSLFPSIWGDIVTRQNDIVVAAPVDSIGEDSLYRFDFDLNLLSSWGTRTTDDNPRRTEFWSPRRFVAVRPDNTLVVIDQQNNGPDETDGRGRVLNFTYGSAAGWEDFGSSEFGFFATGTNYVE